MYLKRKAHLKTAIYFSTAIKGKNGMSCEVEKLITAKHGKDHSLVLMRNWLETPGWSTSWIALAKMAARISRSVNTACEDKRCNITIWAQQNNEHNLTVWTSLFNPSKPGSFKREENGLEQRGTTWTCRIRNYDLCYPLQNVLNRFLLPALMNTT